MYSYEERIRAVKLYIKLGKRLRPAIRQVGYPTKNALLGWFREYEQKLICTSAMLVGSRSTRRRREKLHCRTMPPTIDALRHLYASVSP